MKKLMNKKAFTIMEMLIVVAIIAVLVAIAIPTFSNALDKAKAAADVANVRAGYAELQVAVMINDEALPADKSAFVSNYVKQGLNNENALEYTPGTASNGQRTDTIKYTNDKLDGSPYEWTVTGKIAAAAQGDQGND